MYQVAVIYILALIFNNVCSRCLPATRANRMPKNCKFGSYWDSFCGEERCYMGPGENCNAEGWLGKCAPTLDCSKCHKCVGMVRNELTKVWEDNIETGCLNRSMKRIAQEISPMYDNSNYDEYEKDNILIYK